MKDKSKLLLLHQGHYDLVIDSVDLNFVISNELTASICALALSGKHEQAESLWEAKKTKLNLQQKIHCCFHLSIAEIRKSNLRKAKYYLKLNLELDLKKQYPETSQGIAFYFYYLGHYRRAIKIATKVYRQAIEAHDSYLQTLSLDIIAHCKIQTGYLSQGLKLFDEVKKIAQINSYEKLAFVVEIAKMNYSIEAGNFFSRGLEEIDYLQKQFKVVDSYSEANIALLRARQNILIGDWEMAEDILNNSSQIIYGFENRRQEVHLHIRQADIAFRRNNLLMAQHFIRAARLCLPYILDKTFEIRILMMEHKLVKQDLEKASKLKKQIKLLFLQSPFFFDPIFCDSEICNELTLKFREVTPLTRDRNQFSNSEIDSTNELIRFNYLGLLPEFLGFNNLDVLYIMDNFMGIIKSHKGVSLLPSKFSPMQRRILVYLNETKSATKEALIKSLWNYTYDPFRHDAIVYAAILNLRKCLGINSSLLETSESGWRLKSTLKVIFQTYPKKIEKIVDEFPELPEVENNLNYRQVKALIIATEGSFWTVAKYKAHFQISTMSAWRDLNSLVNLKKIYIRGHGKLTTYHLLKSK